MAYKYRAFLSYSSRYADWVEVLYRNLERVFGTGSVFLDRTSIRPGQSWVAALEQGLGEAQFLVLVATPEAFASPWVLQEIEGEQVDLEERLGDHCILWANSSEILGFPFDVTVEHCIVEGGYFGLNNLDQDPLFVDAPAGGPRVAASSPNDGAPRLRRGGSDRPVVPRRQRRRGLHGHPVAAPVRLRPPE